MAATLLGRCDRRISNPILIKDRAIAVRRPAITLELACHVVPRRLRRLT
jgi:hypothetical protein